MKNKTKVQVLYPGNKPHVPTWPYIDYDYQKRAEEIGELLKRNLPDIEFSQSFLYSKEEAEEIMEGEKADGYLVYMIGLGWGGIAERIMSKRYPTILVDDLYAGSGGFLYAYSYAKKENFPIVGIASSKFNEVINAVGLFKVIKSMKESKILLVTDIKPSVSDRFDSHMKMVKDLFGTEVIRIGSDELESYYHNADENEAKKWADKWINEALRVVEPSKDEIIKSAKMYLALKKAMEDKDVDAVTVQVFTKL